MATDAKASECEALEAALTLVDTFLDELGVAERLTDDQADALELRQSTLRLAILAYGRAMREADKEAAKGTRWYTKKEKADTRYESAYGAGYEAGAIDAAAAIEALSGDPR